MNCPSHRRVQLTTLSLLGVLLVTAGSTAQQPATEVDRKPRVVISSVNETELLQAEFDARRAQMPQPESETAEVRLHREARLLDVLIQQELVRQYLEQRSLGASAAAVEKEMATWKQQLAEREITPREYFEQTGLDAQAVRRRLEWNLRWPRYCDKKLTSDNLTKHFQNNRRDFDGTRIHAAHIFWPATDPTAIEQSTSAADKVRRLIQAGDLTFSDAAAQYSSAPSKDDGGDVGWIERFQPMTPEFSRAAFRLQKGELSLPVLSSLGVHLIQCLDVEPGQKTLSEVRDMVVASARRKLFTTLAERQRKSARIEMPKRAE